MADQSDYDLPRTKMHELLPDPLDSEANRAVFENTFNRFLTKPETERVAGYIGQGNPSALVSRQIPEPTVFRQANQLQPVLYNKIGSIDHITSWKDLLNELERLGVDIDRLPLWGSVQSFNWVPPIDIDKVINYLDYFWVDDTDGQPEYITIKNRCTTLTAQAEFFQRVIDANKPLFDIVGIDTTEPGSPFAYDKLIVVGDYTQLFEQGFEFFVKGSANPDLNNTTFTTVKSTLVGNQTVIQIDQPFNDPTTSGGTISLEERLAALELERDEQCSTPKGPSGMEPVVLSNNQWISTNKWVHRTQVDNFSVARQAQLPIIEFDDNLELNEWTCTEHFWKYRSSTSNVFASTTAKPTLVELKPLPYTIAGNELTLRDSDGDQTSVFVPGSVFENSQGSTLQVQSSRYEQANSFSPYKTIITATPLTLGLLTADGDDEIHPLLTSQGDTWAGYDQQWVFEESAPSTAAPHQTVNPFVTTPETSPLTTANYTTTRTPYAQTYTVTSATDEFPLHNLPQGGWDTAASQRAIKGQNDVRVYVDGVRVNGTYAEQTETDIANGAPGFDDKYVAGVKFTSQQAVGTVIRIEVGSATMADIGYQDLTVRVVEDDVEYGIDPAAARRNLSLTVCRKVEQIKTTRNQYPLFDLYRTNQQSANESSNIFGYKTSQDAPINTEVAQRVVVDASGTSFAFVQSLVGPEGQLRAYRTYDNSTAQYWVDVQEGTVWFWNGFAWDQSGFQGTRYTKAILSPTEPTTDNFQGRVWFDTTNEVLFEYDAGIYSPLDDVVVTSSDPYLQTIWRKGTNSERYVPAKRDWKGRTFEEYLEEQEQFTSTYTPQSEALAEWYKTQYNPLSPTGVWVGDWEIPDPLYYNNLHENKAEITSSQLIAHFNSIKEAQLAQPGFIGPTAGRFHSLPREDVNFGVGGTIHEYNSAFDTLLSSLFVNNVTPITLFEFARDQYEVLINSLRENFRDELFDLMVSPDATTITQFQDTATNLVLEQFRQNDANDSTYGDSLTFVDNAGANDKGLANWISTLPFFNILPRTLPHYIADEDTTVNQIVHHDGHRRDYNLTAATKDGVTRRVLASPDSRASGGVTTWGVQTPAAPPNTVAEFETAFAGNMDDRHGTFWYQTTPQGRTLYRLTVANAGISQPPQSLADGTLWMDLTANQEVLRVKNGLAWDIVKDTNGVPLIPGQGRLHNSANPTNLDAATISAYQVFNMDELLAGIVLAAEERLYETAPETFTPVFDFAKLQTTPADVALYAELEEKAFLDYVRQSEIPAPYVNLNYTATDAFTWNYRFSAPGQRYDITNASTISNTFTIAGEQVSNFPLLPITVFVKNSGSNDGTWTITAATQANGQTTLTVAEPVSDSLDGLLYVGSLPSQDANDGSESAGDYRSLYEQFYNTPYPHLEPWKIQGYTDKPAWWDDEYQSPTPDRRWTDTMWDNLELGTVPSGYLLPDGITESGGVPGEVVQYQYFSVNTTTDALLPPYYDYIAAGQPMNTRNRSIFSTIGEVIAPAADSSFGERGQTETDWRMSSQYLYDQLDIAFQMTPLETISSIFGFECDTIGELCVDKRTEQTPAHNRTKFHGEVLEDGSILKVAGINQWYVNYNRFQGYDSSLSDFRRMWTDWTAPLTYQFASFVDTSSFQLGHRTVPISEFDYQIVSKRSPGVEDFWLNALNVTVLSVPPRQQRINVQSSWVLEVDINSPLTQTIEYYDVKNYKFLADPTTSICQLYTFNIVGVDFFNETIRVAGDQTDTFAFGRTLEIKNSTGNDGGYTIQSAVYDRTTDRTIVSLTSPLPSPTANGVVTVNYRTLPWETGDEVWVTSDNTMPVPLVDEQPTIGPIVYFVIKLSDTEFMFANTKQNALSNLPIQLTSAGTGTTRVGELHSTFYALDRQTNADLWRHYAIDKTNVKTITPPTTIRSMQELVDIVAGYSVYLEDVGFRFNANSTLSDPDTGRSVNWQVEIERFIDFAYTLQSRSNTNIGNRFEATVDPSSNVWTYGAYRGPFQSGDAVHVLSTTGVQPTPILTGVRYYVIRDTDETFRLANTRLDALNGVAIDITDTPDSSTMLMVYKAATVRTEFPSQEINPFRNSAFFRPPRGVVSNLVAGPTEDIRNTQLLFDQYGEPINPATARIYRQDEQTHIQVVEGVPNPRAPAFLFENPYDNLHLGGAHIFIDTYEHVLIFNDETTDGVLLYDPFIGLNVTKFEMIFDRQASFTQRPNVGGSYYQTFFNQGGSLRDNFEANIENIRYLYDISKSREGKRLTQEARRSIGYEGSADYLSDLALNQKSQFLFWRGLIQNKGAVTSINAFINSRRFIDAKVDEFWAYKIADFGSVEVPEYPEMYVNPNDVRFNDLRIEFVESAANCIPGFGNGGFSDVGCGFDIVSTDTDLNIGEGLTVVALSDQERWFNQPDIAAILGDDGSALYFELSVVDSVTLTNQTAQSIRHNFATDLEVVTLETETAGTKYQVTATAGQTVVPTGAPFVPFSQHIRVFKNGSQLVSGVDYTDVTNQASSFATEIEMVFPLNAGDVIEIVFVVATLQVGTHFDRVSSDVLRFKKTDIVDPSYTYTVWGYRADGASQNPATLIDRGSNTTLSPIQLWDPARGLDYQAVLPIIDLRLDEDPAVYSETLTEDQLQNDVQLAYWNQTEVGTVWQDTSRRAYVPYFDQAKFNSLDDRLRVWGRLADWAENKLYEWVESNVPPEEYNDLALEEVGNKEIPEHLRKSGRARETLFELINDQWTVLDDKYQDVTAEIDGLLVSPREYQFQLDAAALGLSTDAEADNFVSVYVDGIARISPDGLGFEVADPFTITIDNLNATDSIRFIKFKPSEQQIQQGEETGIYRRVFEHTTVPTTDEFGQLTQKYYFWVEDKVTRNKTQKISPRTAEQQLTTIPIPYLVTTGAQPAERRALNAVSIPRTLRYRLGANDLSPTGLGYQIAAQTQDDYAQFTGGTVGGVPYQLGDVITLTNGMEVTVTAVDALGLVTEFDVSVPDLDDTITPFGNGVLQQASVVDENNGPSGATGFFVVLDGQTRTENEHLVAIGTPLQVQLRPGMDESDFNGVGDNGTFDGGLTDADPSTNYTLNTLITLSNGAVVRVTGVDGATGDVSQFDVIQPGNPFVLGSTLIEDSTVPVESNSGFSLTPNVRNVQVQSVRIDGRELTPIVEYTIDPTSRIIVIDQIAGPLEDSVIEVEYDALVPQQVIDIPPRHTELVIRGLRRFINEDRRFTIRFTRDFSLRDNLEKGATGLSLKQSHQEWALIRRDQPFKIPEQLWQRLVESMVGYKLDDPTVAVPTLNRVLYDARYGTDTRIGLGEGQAFTDKTNAIDTIQFELLNPDVELTNIDINQFFEAHSFDTPANIEAAMTTIYNTFSAPDINRLFFATLHDAFALKREYAEIFKTSMIAVHGIRPFQTSGLFDD